MPMRLLILGGTRFVGLHLVDAALARGWDVTLLNRGIARSEPLPGVTSVTADRDGGLAALGPGPWDAVVDTSGYFPRLVRDAATFLRGRAATYTFISTISVYADFSAPGLREGAPLAPIQADPGVEVVNGTTYGPSKAMCEDAVRSVFGGHSLIVRPGLIVGPYDPTDRFTYWPLRFAAGGRVIAPEGPAWPVQFIDARDLAAWLVQMLEAGQTGTYHVTSPAGLHTFGTVVEACAAQSASSASVEWVPGRFLLEQGVAPWSELPLWVPAERAGLVGVDVGKAVAAGLRLRPLAETVRDTLTWARGRGPGPARAGLAAPREREVLAAWDAVKAASNLPQQG